ncbi:hypothetical protein RYX36_004102 [Vicia faba]
MLEENEVTNGNREANRVVIVVLPLVYFHLQGQEAVIENAHIIINGLIKLVDYPHKTEDTTKKF